ncbi:hypothetical protein QFC22_004248 [Naganishia vaughanmartiniae]|uniref:Uncharacterized protein n=1 Tax=Naganishia vaughanmartiniae TaxID=1424756 RepID=A0ACC2X4R7_9TREE|nr:hypothetical protein QFC22_004248 [Naganishia vaughanmartiniae]
MARPAQYLTPPFGRPQDDYGIHGPKSGRVKCNLGVIYLSGGGSSDSSLKGPIITATGQTHLSTSLTSTTAAAAYPLVPALSEKQSHPDVSSVTHSDMQKDEMTGYPAPGSVKFVWDGERRDKAGRVKAQVEVQTGREKGEKGLIEKVRVFLFFGVCMPVLPSR